MALTKWIRFLLALIVAVLAVVVLVSVLSLFLWSLTAALLATLLVFVVAPDESKAFWRAIASHLDGWIERLEALWNDICRGVSQSAEAVSAMAAGMAQAQAQASQEEVPTPEVTVEAVEATPPSDAPKAP